MVGWWEVYGSAHGYVERRVASKEMKIQELKNGLKFYETFKESFKKFHKVSASFTKFQQKNYHTTIFESFLKKLNVCHLI